MRRSLRDHRQRLCDLGAEDRKHRCDHCLEPFRGLVVEDFLFDGRFCSDDCLKAAQEVARMKEAAK